MSELALRLIAENKRSKATFLDLGNCGLTELPPGIGDLTWLESLALASTWWEWNGQGWESKDSANDGKPNDQLDIDRLSELVRLRFLFLHGVVSLAPLAFLRTLETLFARNIADCSLAPLAGLPALQSLILYKTKVTDLAPLAGLPALQTLDVSSTQVTDLSPLAGLPALQTLDVSSTQVTDLSPLAGLPALQTLDVSGTQVTDLSPLAGLPALQTLKVSRTQVTDLAPLAGLPALQTLNVFNTQVTDLAPLAGLPALQTLNVYNTQVTDLAPLAGLPALQSLDVSDTQVTDLAPLAGLPALQSLDISGTQVTDLAPLAGLPALQSLIVYNTQVTGLAPLAGLPALQTLNVYNTRVTDLAPLAGLPALQTLNVYNTQVTDLAPLAGLPALQTLYLSGTQVTDLAPLAGLPALQTLDVRDTQVTDLAPLAGLPALQSLYVSGTQVTDLAPLAGLPALQTLNVSASQVTDLLPVLDFIRHGLSVHWSSKHWEGRGIYVENCPLTSPPPEIVKQGNAAILNYFEERQHGLIDHLYEAKMLIVGEPGAGKTSLLRRLYQPDRLLPEERETTKGIDIYRHEFDLKNGRRFRLNVWDFGGQEIYHATHQFFLTRRSLYVLVDDTRQNHKSVSDREFKYWLESVDIFGGHSPVLIFQNEKGGRSKAIDIGGIKGRFDNVLQLYMGNLEHSDAADELRGAINFFAAGLQHIGDELPARWISVRADIEVRAREVPHITQHEYFEIYRRHMDFDSSRALFLSRYLHDLGVFLHFQDDPLLARTVILQNQWATEAVFRILDDETVKKQLGRFHRADCERLWRDSLYAAMHPELLALMQRFELCYELRDSGEPAWLAPQLLPPQKPPELAVWGKPDELVLRYRYDFLPKGVISRLTVRLHRFVRRPEMAWITGVLFERDTTGVLVEVLASGNEIELRARGPESKELLSVVAADLDALNESFPGLKDKIDKHIPCNCPDCSTAATPHFYEHKHLLRRKEHQRFEVECPISFRQVNVLALLDGIRLDNLPVWANEKTIRIFLASSSELKEEREAFALHFLEQNAQFRNRGHSVEFVRWENFLDAMSKTRLQDEYNKAIRDCDVVVCLFFTKTGQYTEEEFDTAWRQFQQTGRPLIYIYCKNADVKTGSARKEDLLSLWNFKEKVEQLGHFHSSYDNIEHLKRHFGDQLNKLFN